MISGTEPAPGSDADPADTPGPADPVPEVSPTPKVEPDSEVSSTPKSSPAPTGAPTPKVGSTPNPNPARGPAPTVKKAPKNDKAPADEPALVEDAIMANDAILAAGTISADDAETQATLVDVEDQRIVQIRAALTAMLQTGGVEAAKRKQPQVFASAHGRTLVLPARSTDTPYTLKDLAAVEKGRYLRRMKDGSYLLGVHVFVADGARLQLRGPLTLRMGSLPARSARSSRSAATSRSRAPPRGRCGSPAGTCGPRSRT